MTDAPETPQAAETPEAPETPEANETPEAAETPAEMPTADVEVPPDAPETQAETAETTEGEDDEEAEAPEPMPALAAELLGRLERELGEGIVESDHTYGDLVVRVAPGAWRKAAEVCRDKLACDYLSFVSGLDWAPAPKVGEEAGGDTSAPVQPTEMTYGVAGSSGRLQVFARVSSTSKHHGVTLKTDVDDRHPRAESWVSVYPGADWHERETWEMFGVAFDGHPAIRHLYLHAEFEGNPLRKDFPLLAREVKPWPGLVDVEGMPGEEATEDGTAEAPAEADGSS
ncbi:MAG: NADH-quinone oxidoreductase subunit C [Acidimicrobiia bacterium]